MTAPELDPQDVLDLVKLIMAVMPRDASAGDASSVHGFKVMLADPYELARVMVAEGWRRPDV